ncbi:MAG: PBP1A family penicillin-binding protein [bacterium]|nr:PBP1A family penicillin-binding protein [bacterium]
MRTVKYILGIGIALAAAGAVFGIATFIYISKNLPDPATFDSRKVAQSSKIYDREGAALLYEIHGEENRTVIPFSAIPELAKKATIAIEDAGFYEHAALDWKSIVRAMLVNIRERRLAQGASTITQQLAKNAFLTPEKTISRKLKELALAFRLESQYAKDKILDLYLNQIPYGANAYGIEAASQTYFRKSAKELSLPEIAVLASLPRAPSYYSPWGNHKDELLRRKDLVLQRMADIGFVAPDEAAKAKEASVEFTQQITQIAAPHFVMAVQDYLNTQYGEEFVRTAGLKVTTTLDTKLQEAAERVVMEGAKRNEELYSGKNAALVAQDARTGQILAMVGSRDYFDATIDGNFNVATQGLRQPGSTMKPFAYLTAFKKGFTPDTILFDLETEFDTSEDPEKSYKPQNFDEQFRGPVRMKESLVQSVNVTSVKTLYLAGIDSVLKTARDFGITTLTERSRYGLSLVLGGGEVRPIDLVGAYATFSQDGVHHKQTFILRVEDASGKILEEYKDEATQVIDPQYPRMINEILSDVDLRRPLFQNSLLLTTFPNQEVALKTGTTNDYRDAWAVGYTPSFVVGVWAGNNDNAPMIKRGSSILAAVPIWGAFMDELLKDKPMETFSRPEPTFVEKPALRGDIVVNNQVHDILYYVNKNDPQGPAPLFPDEDSQFKNWEDPVLEWLKTHPIETLPRGTQVIASTTDAGALTLTIEQPVSGSFIKNSVIVDITITSPSPVDNIELRFNTQLMSIASGQMLTKTGDYTYRYRTEIPVANPQLQNILNIKVLAGNSKMVEKDIILFR